MDGWKILGIVLAVLTVVGLLLGLVVDLGSILSAIRGWFRRKQATQTLSQFAPGRWRSMGGSNELVIATDLSWSWTSTHQGRWHGSGRGDVRDGYLVLHGTREGLDSLGRPVPRYPITLQLERQSDRLEGSIQTMLKSEVIFVRDESARAEG